MRTYIVGSRQSELALTQTKAVINTLKVRAAEQGIACEFNIRTFVTKGDRNLDVSLTKVGGKGLFVKEIQQALLNGEIDMAVHSMKDVPSDLPKGLMIGAMPERADARDCIISRQRVSFKDLPAGARIGTSSLRRSAQILASRHDLTTAWIRGNVGTRLKKLEAGEYEAIVLAVAGLQRLGWEHKISDILSIDECLPAVGQGALGVECRATDEELIQLLQLINDTNTEKAITAERSLLSALEGGCSTPIGAYAVVNNEGTITLTGMVSTVDGQRILKETVQGTEADALGRAVAHRLIEQGAKRILAKLSQEQ